MSRGIRARAALACALLAAGAVGPAEAAQAAKRADLRVSQLANPPASVQPGGAFRVSVTVSNRGARAGATRVAFHLARGARLRRGDVRLSSMRRVGALRDRQRSRGSVRVTVPRGIRRGTYRLIACADAQRKVRERSESNNCRTAARAVRVAPADGGPTTPPPPLEGSGQAGGTVTGPPPGQQPGPGNPGPGPGDPGPGPGDPGPGPGNPGGGSGHTPANPPPLDKGAPTSMADSTDFLYTGPDPVQQGVAPGTISPKRVAILRGRVLDSDGRGLSGVTVTVLDHPELGRTHTRSGGAYDIAVNGGGPLTLVFEHADHIPLQRTTATEWQEFEAVEDVVLTRWDPNARTVEPAAAGSFSVARGSRENDATGTRQATLLFPPGTRATLELPDGGRRTLERFTVRATEFTVGAEGPAAMPGELPATSAYTYAAEFSLDEAVRAGAERVRFDKRVISYTENFTGAPVGALVPVGSYERDEAGWVPKPDGVVLKVLRHVDGRAEIDVTGDGEKDEPEWFSEEEARHVRSLYGPGTEVWRVTLDSFSPKDFNYAPNRNNPPSPPPPPRKDQDKEDCSQRGSVIGCERQTLGERVPVAGTGMELAYQSERTLGWKSANVLDVPLTTNDVSSDLAQIDVEVEVAGQVQRHTIHRGDEGFGPGKRHRFVWNGRDAYGRRVIGRPPATIKVAYVYDFRITFIKPPPALSSGGRVSGGGGAFVTFAGWGFNDRAEEGGGGGGGAGFRREYFSPRPCEAETSDMFSETYLCGTAWRYSHVRSVGIWRAQDAAALGGWTLSEHHGYDPQDRVLHLGDGTARKAEAAGRQVTSIAGAAFGTRFPEAEGGPNTDARLDYMVDFGMGPDGSVYAGDDQNDRHHVIRFGADGRVRSIAGKSEPEADNTLRNPTGDGGPALEAWLGRQIEAVHAAPDGAVYVSVIDSDSNGHIRKLSPRGDGTYTISTLIGRRGRATEVTRDGTPASEARIGQVIDMATGPDGSFFFTERGHYPNGNHNLIRQIGLDGRLRTVAGGGSQALPGRDESQRALDVSLTPSYGLAFAPDGTLLFALPGRRTVMKVDPDGSMTRVAGSGAYGDEGNGGPAVDAAIGDPINVAVEPTGEILIRSNEGSFAGIRRVAHDGTVTRVAGVRSGDHTGCWSCFGPQDEAAESTPIRTVSRGLEVSPDGDVVFSDGRYRVRTIRQPLPGFERHDVGIPSVDGSELYQFSGSGRHLRTIDTLTGAIRWRFGYDAERRLTTITDVDGDVTRVERDAQGRPTAIVAPGGQRTALAVDTGGHLSAITDPAGAVTRMATTAEGLLQSIQRPGDARHEFGYDSLGRLTSDRDAAGGVKTLARFERGDGQGHRVRVTSAEGRHTDYEYRELPSGTRQRRVIDANGGVSELEDSWNGAQTLSEPDGTVTVTRVGLDPRFGRGAPVLESMTVRTPAGRTQSLSTTRTAELADPADPLSLRRLTQRVTQGQRELTHEYLAEGRRLTTRTGQGRQEAETLDADGRTVGYAASGTEPVEVGYDDRGRLVSLRQGTRNVAFGYDERNRLVSRRDAHGREIRLGHDAADRLTSVRLPSGRTYGFSYDAAGNRTEVRMPGGGTHVLRWDERRLHTGYRPPGGGLLATAFDRDGLLGEMTRPSGRQVTTAYDEAGRERGSQAPDADVAYGYAGRSSRVAEATRTPSGGGGAQRTEMSHDGIVPTGAAWAGAAAGAVSWEWTEGFELSRTSLTVGEQTVETAVGHDRDGELTRSGPFTLQRSGPGGTVSQLGDERLAQTYDYDGTGRVRSKRYVVNGREVYRVQLTRDASDRLTGRTETVGSQSRADAFDHDADGQLVRVRRGAATAEEYAYDQRGNRTSRRLGTEPAAGAAHDAQDRLTGLGGRAVTVDEDGFLARKGSGDSADTFSYGARGELLSARVGGSMVRYSYDSRGRRVARTEGEQTTRYYYANLDNPLEVSAVRSPGGTLTTLRYDADGHLVALERGDERWYVATDQVGTPRVVSNREGDVVRRLEWDAFGMPVPVPGEEPTGPEVPLGFAGGLADPVTGLVSFGRRDYDPHAGRWAARDPILYEGGQGNLYAYVGNDPVDGVDPTGMGEPGGGSWFQTGTQAVGDTFTGVAKDAAKQYARDSVESVRLKSLDDAHNVFQDKLKSKAEDAVKFSPRDEYLQQLERAEKNKPAVDRLTDRVTNLWRRAARALGGCPEPPERRPPGPPPRLQEFKPR